MNNNIENLNPDLDHFIDTLNTLLANWHEKPSKKAATGEDGFVIAINGQWGSGKTFFVDYYLKHLHENSLSPLNNPIKPHIIKFNAFRVDSITDPFVAITGALYEQYPTDLSASKKITKYAVRIIHAIYKSAKIGFSFIPGGEGVNKCLELVEENIDEQKKDTALFPLVKELSAYREFHIAQNCFKESLANLGKKAKQKAPLKIFIIDELDRCQPLFAIQVLERIKHLFETKNTAFIFTIDKRNLESVVRKVYGNDFNAEHYLSRFFDIELDLPSSSDFTKKLIQQQLEFNFANLYEDCLVGISDFLNLQPREIIKICKYFTMYSPENPIDADVFFLLIALKLYHRNFFDKIIMFPRGFNQDSPILDNLINFFDEKFRTRSSNDLRSPIEQNRHSKLNNVFDKLNKKLIILNSSCTQRKKHLHFDEYKQNKAIHDEFEKMIYFIKYLR